MTSDEQSAAQGRILNDYLEAKTRLETLKGEANRLIRDLNTLARQVDNFESAPVNYNMAFLDAAKIQKLLNDLRQTGQDKQKYEQQLRSMGLNLSDK